MLTAARENCWRNQVQMREFYNSLDLYICASRSEGTPNPCLEAAACGIPVLTTPVGNMPEFIENGINGLFIKRNVDDIAEKLMLMRDNCILREHISSNARKSSLRWDWHKKAKNYKYMFKAVLQGKSKKSLFHSPEQVYVASADKMEAVLNNCRQFIQVPNHDIDSYVSVIGGMSGLNYLSMMTPRSITFFDVNYSAVEYMKCLFEIIHMSDKPKNFVSRVFCRSIEEFLKNNNYDDLTVFNQNEYLNMQCDVDMYRELLSNLSPFSQKIYKKYLAPHLPGKVLSGVKNCRHLVPCFPIHERVPVGGGQENGTNEFGELVPNLNTFFYGHGWLASDDAYNHVKMVLKTSNMRCMAFDLFKDELDLLAEFCGNVVIHCSNIDDWFPKKWNNWFKEVSEKSIRQRGELAIITTNGGVRHSFFDPHMKAYEAIRPYVYGKITEVTHKAPWGFHEFKRTVIIFDDYINGNSPESDTTIIHNLVGEGVKQKTFEEVCRVACQKSNRVIILEHNQNSLDFRNNENHKSYMTITQLQDNLIKIAKPFNALVHPVVKIPGYHDLSRNTLFVIDICNSFDPKKIETKKHENFFHAKSHLSGQPIDLAETGPELIIATNDQRDKELPITAIIATYNESDVIYHVIKDYVEQNINVYLIDNHSTDSNVEQASKWLGKGLIGIEKFPSETDRQVDKSIYSWRYILQRKEQVVKELGDGWYIHADADEFREAPWNELNLRQGIERVDKEGCNAINFKIFDFKPTANNFRPGDDVRKYLEYYDPDIHAFNRVQIKCWKYTGQEFSLWPSGGHRVDFQERKLYPIPFILRHYAIRSQNHGLQKVFTDRKARFDKKERDAKWHDQYDKIKDRHYQFVRDSSGLTLYDREVACSQILGLDKPSNSSTARYYDFIRPEIQTMVDHNAKTILDVGCAAGKMAAALKYKLGAEVWGVELVDEIAKQASEELDNVIIGDIAAALPKIPEAYFDTIIFADVLEHLADPYSVLDKVQSKLKSGGQVVASIPNVQHWSVLKDLLEGRWEYKSAGILDKTHLRFFTRKSVIELFQNAGYKILDVKATVLENQCIPDRIVKALSNTGLEVSSLAEDSRYYQYIVKAVPLKVDAENKPIKPLISIIILTFNQVEYTQKCLESIFKHTPELFELIIVDNGSTDGTVGYMQSEILDKHGDVKISIIKNTENKGFAGGINQGIAASTGDYVLLLNNDVVVTPGWLERLITCCEKRPEIGIVGPKSNFVSGPQLVETADYDLDSLSGLKRFSERFATINSKKSKRLLRVVGFCMLIKRSVIDKIGGMDDRYGIGNFEDDDFSIRAALAGFESWMAEDCFVHHFGSRTFKGENIDYRNSLHTNWKLFKKKWGLPSHFHYGHPYSLSQMNTTEFNPKRHFVKITENENHFLRHRSKDLATADTEYRLLISIIQKEDSAVVIEKLQAFANRFPDFGAVYNDLGVLFSKNGDNESALVNYERGVKLDPENIIFLKNLADLLVVAFERFDEALRHYVKVLGSKPMDIEALAATGHICARMERYDDATEFYEKVLKIEPNNSDAPNWLAKMREKRSPKSVEQDLDDRYRTMLNEIDHVDFAGAIQAIEKFIEIYPHHGQAHNDLGVLYYKNESKNNALARYLKAVELEPENITFRKNLADYLYVEEGRVEDALENYVEVLRIKPDDVETLLISGHICTAIERFEDAMSFYQKVIDIEPQNLEARQNLEALEKRKVLILNQEIKTVEKPEKAAEVNKVEPHASVDEVAIVQTGVVEELINKADSLFQQEQIDKAVDIFLKAIAANPLDGRTYIELAGQLLNHGRYENALEVLAEIPANQPEAVANKQLLLEGYSQEGMGNYAAAKKCCGLVIERDLDNVKALNLIGILAYRNGDTETAEQHFKRSIELNHKYGEPHTNLGALVWEKGDSKKALEYYERGFSISPTDIEVANAYHEAISATGEHKRAEKVARNALKRFPHCRKVLYLLIDLLIRQEKTQEALKELEIALSTFGIDEGLLDTAIALRKQVGIIKKTGSAKKPGVSLCMIVKDEEANLARCLASVKPIVDEMIVVDTGSTDRTRDIAEFFGARVYDFKWCGDFSESRNFSLSKAKGGWILIMDADEMISPKDYNRFRKLTGKKASGLMGYSMVTRNYCNMANTIGWIPNTGQYISEENGLGWLSSEKVRLFSNSSKIKFEGAVHEMVDPVLKRNGIKIKQNKIPIHHYGRLNTDKLARKDQTYYEIGRKKLLKNGGDIGTVRELAIQATILEKNSEAIELWQKFLSTGPGETEVSDAYVNMVSAYIRMQDYNNALTLAQKAVSISPQMKEAQYNLGIAELYKGNTDAAFKTFKKLTQRHPDFPPAHFLLAASNYCRKDAVDMSGNIKKLKQSAFGPALTYSFAELAEGLIAAHQHKLAFKLLQNAIEDEIISKSILGLYTICLEKIKETNKVSDMIFENVDTLS
ncbi:MAG: glycosyltransferase [Desulfobacterales bacterium]